MKDKKEKEKETQKSINLSSPFLSFALLAIAVGVLFIFYEVLRGLYYLLTSGSDTSKIVTGGSITILVAIVSSAFTKYYEQKNAIQADLRERKTPIYESFIKFTLDTMFSATKNPQGIEEKAFDFFAEFTPSLALWGTDEVVKAYLSFRRFSTSEEYKNQPTRILIELENVVLAMRKDLGHKNKEINSGDILTMFITDPESFKSSLSEKNSNDNI